MSDCATWDGTVDNWNESVIVWDICYVVQITDNVVTNIAIEHIPTSVEKDRPRKIYLRFEMNGISKKMEAFKNTKSLKLRDVQFIQPEIEKPKLIFVL